MKTAFDDAAADDDKSVFLDNFFLDEFYSSINFSGQTFLESSSTPNWFHSDRRLQNVLTESLAER